MTVGNQKQLKGDKMNTYINFIVFADYVDLLGPSDSVLEKVRSLLLLRTALVPEHINTTSQIPCGHRLRALIPQACVKSYVWSLQLAGRNSRN